MIGHPRAISYVVGTVQVDFQLQLIVLIGHQRWARVNQVHLKGLFFAVLLLVLV